VFVHVQVHNPTLPELANKTVVQREAIIEKKLKLLGVRGEPMFSELSYFKYDPLISTEI